MNTTLKGLRRQLGAKALPPAVWSLFQLLWKTCKIEYVDGAEHIDKLLEQNQPFIPCYWHQNQLFCVRYLLDRAASDERLKLGYLISPSADGDMATRLFGKQGVHIIRGSATRGGAQALREIYQAIRQLKVSPIVTPDGPTGPIYQFKPGVAMLAQLSSAPLVPISYSASHFWCLRSWDRFLLPKPFARIVIGIGAPVFVDKTAAVDGFEQQCTTMTDVLNELSVSTMEKIEHEVCK